MFDLQFLVFSGGVSHAIGQSLITKLLYVNTLIVIRMWSIFRNSVLKIGCLVFPPKITVSIWKLNSSYK